MFINLGRTDVYLIKYLSINYVHNFYLYLYIKFHLNILIKLCSDELKGNEKEELFL